MKRTYSLTAVGLSVSLFIYLIYRSKSTVVNELMASILSSDTYNQIRTSVRDAIPLNEAIIFSLPGGLWLFCVTILSRDLYIDIKEYKIKIAVLPLLFAIGLEFMQLLHFNRGTFDLWDLGSYLVFWLPGYYGFQSRSSQQNVLSVFTLEGFICVTCFLSVYLAHVNS